MASRWAGQTAELQGLFRQEMAGRSGGHSITSGGPASDKEEAQKLRRSKNIPLSQELNSRQLNYFSWTQLCGLFHLSVEQINLTEPGTQPQTSELCMTPALSQLGYLHRRWTDIVQLNQELNHRPQNYCSCTQVIELFASVLHRFYLTEQRTEPQTSELLFLHIGNWTFHTAVLNGSYLTELGTESRSSRLLFCTEYLDYFHISAQLEKGYY